MTADDNQEALIQLVAVLAVTFAIVMLAAVVGALL